MSKDEFRQMLSSAVAGNEDALADLFGQYMPLINRYSYIDGRIDEDLRQCILVEIFKSLQNFNFFAEGD